MDKSRRTRWGLEKGNVDLTDRPKVKNPDGSVSTVLSGSYNMGGKEVLLPHIGATGTFGTGKTKARQLSGQEAREIYAKTGKNLGKFRTPQQADQYAKALHVMQEKAYK